MLIEINPQNPQKRLVRIVVKTIKEGGIIAFPTDTHYGIGCDLMNKKAIEKIYILKQRKKNKPFSFICSDLKNISLYGKVSNYAYKTMRRLLPGPYTFILPGSKLVPKIMLYNRKTVGIRVPDNKICLEIIKELNNPIISTSASLPNNSIIDTPYIIDETFKSQIDIVIDGGPVPGIASSIISFEDDIPNIIRAGGGDISTI